MLATLTAVQ